jgi:hypothetical protein
MRIHEKYDECAVGEGVKASMTALYGSPFPIEEWNMKKVPCDGVEEFVWVRMA